MVLFNIKQLETLSDQVQEAISQQVDSEDIISLRRKIAELSSLGGLSSNLVASSRYWKDKDKSNTWLYEGCLALDKNLHYSISCLQTLITSIKMDILNSRQTI